MRLFHLETMMLREAEIQKMLLGHLAVRELMQRKSVQTIQEAEFRVFSQWGDDGIIQYLINTLDIPHKKFIEFGISNYLEANTRFLLLHDNWSGLVMDYLPQYIEYIKKDPIYYQYDLTAKQALVNAENINDLVLSSGFEGDIGLLHIDMDGNDYWVWEALTVASPVIVIMEYNAGFGVERPIVIPYEQEFNRRRSHQSTVYYGASLLALCDLAEKKGYAFIGCNSNGGNAYFVRKDKIGDIKVVSPSEGYVLTRSREHKDPEGKPTFISVQEAMEDIRGMPVVNVRTGTTEEF